MMSLQVELLTQLNMFSEALLLLWQILTGDHLPVAGISAAATNRVRPYYHCTLIHVSMCDRLSPNLTIPNQFLTREILG